MAQIPQVSLISSWHASSLSDPVALAGLTYGLRSGLGAFDLYFLGQRDLPWYLEHSEIELDAEVIADPALLDKIRECPLQFAATLSRPSIRKIAVALTLLMTREYAGRRVGPRPQFTAMATYWPFISDSTGPDQPDSPRQLSIRALRNSLLLALELGVRHVEMVGGAAFGISDLTGPRMADEPARNQRMNLLKQGIESVYGETETGRDLLQAPNCPYLCMEIEPGKAYLMQNFKNFLALRDSLSENSAVQEKLLLNVDIAHMFLVDASAPTETPQISQIKGYRPLIGHFHISDHARSHAADLCPGTYHFEEEYREWLKLAVALMDPEIGPHFSRSIAVEMEACADLQEVLRAITRTSQWIDDTILIRETISHGEVSGVVMAVDIAGSTKILANEGHFPEQGARRINAAVSAFCRAIHDHRGSVYSFTGDGVVAIFDYRHFSAPNAAAESALVVSGLLYQEMKKALTDLLDPVDDSPGWGEFEDQLALRVSLHVGKVMIPTHGSLSQQVLGADVIVACRMLEYAEAVLKGGITVMRKSGEKFAIVASGTFKKKVLAVQATWEKQAALVMRGVTDDVQRKTVQGVFALKAPFVDLLYTVSKDSISDALSSGEVAQTGLRHVFLSYNNADRSLVERLRDSLEQRGIKTWWDQDIPAACDWSEAIRTAIKVCYAFFLCQSEQHQERLMSGTYPELNQAIGHYGKMLPSTPYIFPVKFQHCRFPDISIGHQKRLPDVQSTDLFPPDRWETRVDQLVADLMKSPLYPGKYSKGSDI